MINIVTLNNDISKTCCFTGHRPEKIYGGIEFSSQPMKRLLSVVALHISDLVTKQGYDTFITGMQRGIDLWAAQLVLDMKKRYPYLKVICAMPYRGHGEDFEGLDLWLLHTVIEDAKQVIYVSEQYSDSCMRKRNMFMVDHSSFVLGVMGDKRSGTGMTVNYAKRRGVDYHVIDLNDSAPMFFA